MNKGEEIYNTLKAMSNQDQMWFSIKEAAKFFGIDENTLSKKMISYHIESRSLPGIKGQFISKRDVETIQRGLNPA